MTTDPFRLNRSSNAYDRVHVDVPALYQRFPLHTASTWAIPPSPPSTSLYRLTAPIQWRLAAWKLLHRLRLDQSWFQSFADYWTSALGGRPLVSPDDFHFLRGVYRLRHQDNQVPPTDDPAVHLAAWQQPELLYNLFAQVFWEGLEPKIAQARWLQTLRVQTFCEYGCATAPATSAYRTFIGTKARAVLLDLPALPLHYAAYKFRHDPGVTVMALEPTDRFLPPRDLRVQAVVCMQVLEHVLNPVEVVRALIEMVQPRGYLLFDYIKADARGGMDSEGGFTQRAAALALIEERFDLMHGSPHARRGSGLCVARLRT